MTVKNVHRDEIISELKRWDIQIIGDGQGGDHAYVEALLPNGSRCKFHHSRSRSSEKGRLDNVRSTVRQKLRLLGVELKQISLPPRKIDTTRPRAVLALGAKAPPVTIPKFVEQHSKEQVKPMAETEKKKRHQTLTRTESNLITRFITLNSHERPEDKRLIYIAGWTDDRVAELVTKQCNASPPITAEQVRAERERTFLDWAPEPKKPSQSGGNFGRMLLDIRERVVLLEQLVQEQEVRIKQLEGGKAANSSHDQQETPAWRPASLTQR